MLGSDKDPMWRDFPLALTQTQGARRYVTLFEAPFEASALSDHENNALWVSSLMAVPPPPPGMLLLARLTTVDQLNPVGLIHPRRRLWHENASGGGSQMSPRGHRRGFEQVGDVNPFEILSPLFWDWQQV